ncbi:MAG: sugar transferase [Lachnospiraceae bacterium]|nr:sugar transferase [Lachnospiraceae bacterium]
MNQRYRIFQTYFLWFIDMVCIALSYFIATQIRFAATNDYGNKTLHYMVLVVMLLLCTVYNYFTDWNRGIMRRGYFQEIAAIVQFHVVMITISMAFVFFLRWAYILSRAVVLYFSWISVLLMYAAHLLYKKVIHHMFSNDLLVAKVLVVSRRADMDIVVECLHKELDSTYQIVGVLSVDDLNSDADYRKATERMTQIPFDEVFIYTPGIAQTKLEPLISGFDEMGVSCHYSLELPSIASGAGTVGVFGGYNVITYSRFRISYKKLLIKRAFDIIGGIVGLLLTAVITVFLAPAIKLDSEGPVFFSQTRVGKNGRRFRIYKFRSMYIDAEERLAELQEKNEVKGLMFKMENDPRITRVGAFIRKTSLDEFPQFWNVLKGDMSLVGTRPPTEAEFEQYTEHYRRRISMTPGLTGMWQVSGRSNIDDFDEVVKLDLKYIDNWSLTLDCKILLQTIGVVLFHQGAK